jgi:hypothetical protein
VPEAYTSRQATATTTTTAMMTTNVDDKASGASARHFHIASRSGHDSNYGNDDDKCQRQGLGRKRPAFSYHVAQRQRRQQQLLATTND